jgi:hypothetical protein
VKPEWPQVLAALAGNLEEFPTLNDYDHSRLLVTASLLRIAASEFDQAVNWRHEELADLEHILAESNVEPGAGVAAFRVSEASAMLSDARLRVIELQAAVEDGADEGGPVAGAIRDVIRRGVERRARILDGADSGW